jgi:hypothetical protein
MMTTPITITAAIDASTDLGFDIAEFEDTEIGTIIIKHPITGANTDLKIIIAGPEHPARRKREMERQRKNRAHFAKTGQLFKVEDPQDDFDAETDELVDSTLGWSGLVIGGVATPFSTMTAVHLYSSAKTRWLRDQVKAALGDRQNFISASASA